MEMETLEEIADRQKVKDAYILPSGEIEVPRELGGIMGYKNVRINVDNDADFYVTGVTGSYGYWHVEGMVLKPLPALGSEDVTFRITESSTGRVLSGDYVAVETFFAPGGVGKPLYLVMPFRHLVRKSAALVFEFQNATAHDFRISFALHGVKYF